MSSSTRRDFPWTNSHHIAGDLRTGVQQLKDATAGGVLLGSGKLATELDRLDLIDEYKFLVHPRIAGHGQTLYQSGLPSTRRLELVSAKPLRCGAVAMHYRRARLTNRLADVTWDGARRSLHHQDGRRSHPELAMPLLRALIEELGEVDLFIPSAGTGFDNAALTSERERETIATDVLGFAAMVDVDGRAASRAACRRRRLVRS